jgi:hypothetical protein
MGMPDWRRLRRLLINNLFIIFSFVARRNVVFDKFGNSPLRSRRDYAQEDQDNKPQDYTQEQLIDKSKDVPEIPPVGWKTQEGDVMASNEYLNTPPTKLRRDLKKTKSKAKKKEMKDALNAWRTVVPGPFRKSSESSVDDVKELLKIAKYILEE